MPLAHGDPESIRTFARMLAEFSEISHDKLARLRSFLGEMAGSTWSDAQYHDFEERFSEVDRQIHAALLKVQEEQVPRLLALAARLDEYERT